ncbi:MAG: hypothetical protein ACLRXK_08400 [Acutalibacteraceae bacterium]
MAAEMLKKVIATENEAAENEKNAASEADKIIKKAKDDAEKLLSEKEKECAVYEAAEIKKSQRYGRGYHYRGCKGGSKVRGRIEKTVCGKAFGGCRHRKGYIT